MVVVKKKTPTQEDLDAEALCEALDTVMYSYGWSVARLSEETNIPQQNLRRMMKHQEPKVTQLLHIERVMGLPYGTIMREAGFVNIPVTPEGLLETEPRLSADHRGVAVAIVETLVRLSSGISTSI